MTDRVDLTRDTAAAPYLNRTWTRLFSIPLIGFPHLGDVDGVGVSGFFVVPLARATPLPERTSEADIAAGSEPLLSVVARERRLLILGEPGSGKSALMQWFAHMLGNWAKNPVREAFGGRAPLLLVLRDMKLDAQIATFEDLYAPERIPEDVLLPDERPVMASLLERGLVAVLVDGWDEVGDPATRRAILRALNDGAQRFPGCVFVVSSRPLSGGGGFGDTEVDGPLPGGTPEELSVFESLIGTLPFDVESGASGLDVALPLLGLGLRRASRSPRRPDSGTADGWATTHLSPFRREDIARFAANWYGLRERDPGRQRASVTEFLAALDADPPLFDLARRPALLLLMVLIHRVHGRLPGDRVVLFSKISEAYLESLDAARKLPFSRHPLADQERWLAALAWTMQEARFTPDHADGNGLSLPRQRAAEVISDAMERPADSPEVAAFLEHAQRRAGLLVPRNNEDVAFAHLTFQDYYAALALRDRVTAAFADLEAANLAVGALVRWATGDEGGPEAFRMVVDVLERVPKVLKPMLKRVGGVPGTPEFLESQQSINRLGEAVDHASRFAEGRPCGEALEGLRDALVLHLAKTRPGRKAVIRIVPRWARRIVPFLSNLSSTGTIGVMHDAKLLDLAQVAPNQWPPHVFVGIVDSLTPIAGAAIAATSIESLGLIGPRGPGVALAATEILAPNLLLVNCIPSPGVRWSSHPQSLEIEAEIDIPTWDLTALRRLAPGSTVKISPNLVACLPSDMPPHITVTVVPNLEPPTSPSG